MDTILRGCYGNLLYTYVCQYDMTKEQKICCFFASKNQFLGEEKRAIYVKKMLLSIAFTQPLF